MRLVTCSCGKSFLQDRTWQILFRDECPLSPISGRSREPRVILKADGPLSPKAEGYLPKLVTERKGTP